MGIRETNFPTELSVARSLETLYYTVDTWSIYLLHVEDVLGCIYISKQLLNHFVPVIISQKINGVDL